MTTLPSAIGAEKDTPNAAVEVSIGISISTFGEVVPSPKMCHTMNAIVVQMVSHPNVAIAGEVWRTPVAASKNSIMPRLSSVIAVESVDCNRKINAKAVVAKKTVLGGMFKNRGLVV